MPERKTQIIRHDGCFVENASGHIDRDQRTIVDKIDDWMNPDVNFGGGLEGTNPWFTWHNLLRDNHESVSQEDRARVDQILERGKKRAERIQRSIDAHWEMLNSRRNEK